MRRWKSSRFRPSCLALCLMVGCGSLPGTTNRRVAPPSDLFSSNDLGNDGATIAHANVPASLPPSVESEMDSETGMQEPIENLPEIWIGESGGFAEADEPIEPPMLLAATLKSSKPTRDDSAVATLDIPAPPLTDQSFPALPQADFPEPLDHIVDDDALPLDPVAPNARNPVPDADSDYADSLDPAPLGRSTDGMEVALPKPETMAEDIGADSPESAARVDEASQPAQTKAASVSEPSAMLAIDEASGTIPTTAIDDDLGAAPLDSAEGEVFELPAFANDSVEPNANDVMTEDESSDSSTIPPTDSASSGIVAASETPLAGLGDSNDDVSTPPEISVSTVITAPQFDEVDLVSFDEPSESSASTDTDSQFPSTVERDAISGSDPEGTEVVLKPVDANALVETDGRPPFVDGSSLATTSDARATKPVLTVDNLAFCKEVFGFGSISEAPNDGLRPGQQVLLYAETREFGSHFSGDAYETTLGSVVSIETHDGTPVTSYAFDPVVDRCRERRTDFYCHYTFFLPKRLDAGRYVARLKVTDLLTGEAAERSLSFVVGLSKDEVH